MGKVETQSVAKSVDKIQQCLTDYACKLKYEDLPPVAIHAAKVRLIDTLGALTGAFFRDTGQISRNLAALMPNSDGATVIGTRMKTTPDMAAFVNATTARDAEIIDTYHWPGSFHGHPSDVVMPILAVAENTHASGRDFITGVVLGYEVFQRFSDVFHNEGFDATNFAVIGTSVAAGKLLRLTPSELSHGISMAAVANVMLKQSRKGHLTMFKATASGQAGRAGVFAAYLAKAGMEGPHMPFEGKAGWCDHVALKRFSLDALGGNSTQFKILDTRLKIRPVEGSAISPVLAAEKIAPIKNIKGIQKIIVEVNAHALDRVGSGEHTWNPDTRQTADHSIPFVVAATLMDGTVSLRTFNDANLWNPQLRSLLPKIQVIENEEFTKAFHHLPVEHRTRVTVVTESGDRLIGETGGGEDDLSAQLSDDQVTAKFQDLTADILGTTRGKGILDRLWHLEDVKNMAEVPPALIFA